MKENGENEIGEKNEKQNLSNSEDNADFENSKSNSSESSESIIAKSLPIKLNQISNRLLILSPTVRAGLERECNLNDFYREGDTYIGKGAFGEVWKVTHKKTNKIYVIKVMDKQSIREQKLTEQINREIEIMYKLNHPHVMRLINHFEDDEKFYMVLPYASKGQLYALLRRQVRFDQKTAAQYAREVLEAVRYIHSFSPKIIHRDIKPENILLDENYRVLLSDFGWSNFLEENEFRKTFCGTPEYLSPEMVKRAGHNEMVDIWAIGVLIFEFLAGYAPFSGSSPSELYSNIKKLKINWPVDFPPIAKNLVSKILKLVPSERLSIQEILDHQWFSQNPPLRHVLTNYLTDEKEIIKSHLVLVTPESIEDKINEITDPHKKRRFSTLKRNLLQQNNNEEEEINTNTNNDKKIGENKDGKNEGGEAKHKGENKYIYVSNIHERFLILKKEKKELQKKYEELVLKEAKESILIKTLEEENKKLKSNQPISLNNYYSQIENKVNEYKLLSEDRIKLIEELEQKNLTNYKLISENELLSNQINIMKKQLEELNNTILELKKEKNDYILKIKDLSSKLITDNNDKNSEKISEEINIEKFKEVTEQKIKQINENISPISTTLNNFEKKISDLLNNKLLTFINEGNSKFDNLLNKEEINTNVNNEKLTFEEHKKIIEELENCKMKLLNIDDKKYKTLESKNEILEKKNKTLSEQIKISNSLNNDKSKELEKTNDKIKHLSDKLFDIKEYVSINSKNENFKNRIINFCEIEIVNN